MIKILLVRLLKIKPEVKTEVKLSNEWIEIDYKNMETSHDEILVTNERGWYRVCRCLGGKRNGVDFL